MTIVSPILTGLYRQYRAKGENDKAIADYTEAIRLEPENAQAYHGRGSAYEAKGDHKRAEADFAEAKKLGHAE